MTSPGSVWYFREIYCAVKRFTCENYTRIKIYLDTEAVNAVQFKQKKVLGYRNAPRTAYSAILGNPSESLLMKFILFIQTT